MKIENKCICEHSTGSTHIECCNICGLPLQKEQWYFYLPDENSNQVQAGVMPKIADTKPIEWITAQYELASDRYMFNEKFILELHTSFWKRLFVKYYTRKHLKEILSSFSV